MKQSKPKVEAPTWETILTDLGLTDPDVQIPEQLQKLIDNYEPPKKKKAK